MTRLFILTLLMWVSDTLYGQTADNKIQSFISEQNIDSFLIYSFPCVGNIGLSDSCKEGDTYYLLWTKNKRYFLKQFKTCGTSKILSIDTANPVSFYIANKNIIDKEEIKPPAYYEYRKTAKGFDTIMLSSFIDHSCFHTFSFKVGSRKVEKSVDVYNLDFVKFDNGARNIFYKRNQQTLFKTLIDKTIELISKFDNDKESTLQ